MTVCFRGLFVNGRHHTACRYSGPMVLKFCFCNFFGRYVTMVVNGILFGVMTPQDMYYTTAVPALGCLRVLRDRLFDFKSSLVHRVQNRVYLKLLSPCNVVPPPPPPPLSLSLSLSLSTHTLLTPHFYFPLELYVYITLTNNNLAFFIYQLIILWTMSIN